MKKYRDIIINTILSLVVSYSYIWYLDIDIKTNVYISILFFVLSYMILKERKNKLNLVYLIFSICFALSIVIGKTIYTTNNISNLYSSLGIILKNLLLFISTVILIYYLQLKFLDKIELKSNKQWKLFQKKYTPLFIYLTIALSFFFALLAYYPGIYSYDVHSQTVQALGLEKLTALHPPLHTFIWKTCIDLSNLIHINALTIYSFIQIFILSYSLSSLINIFIRKKINNYLILFSYLFIIFNPVIGIFSIALTKDIYFSSFLLLTIIELLKFITEDNYCDNKFNYLKMIIFILITCLFRNNAIYVFLLLLTFALIIYKKQYKKILLLFLSPIILYYIITIPIYNHLGIKKGSLKEMISIPIQQISLVVYNHHDELNSDDINAINKFFNVETILSKYNYRFSDPIKNNINTKYLSNNKKEFLELYLQLFRKYPNDYLSSFLTLNIPYWYIDSSTNDPYSKRQYIETGIDYYDFFPIERSSKLPLLEKYYESVANCSIIDYIPIFQLLLSISLPIWFLLLTITVMINKKKYKEVLLLLPLLLLWLTYLLGPVSNGRYIFPLYICYPLFSVIIFQCNTIFPKKITLK